MFVIPNGQKKWWWKWDITWYNQATWYNLIYFGVPKAVVPEIQGWDPFSWNQQLPGYNCWTSLVNKHWPKGWGENTVVFPNDFWPLSLAELFEKAMERTIFDCKTANVFFNDGGIEVYTTNIHSFNTGEQSSLGICWEHYIYIYSKWSDHSTVPNWLSN